jgi:arylsulfatase A-like enzyme
MPRAVVLSFDQLHAAYLGSHGNDWIETPHLDRLATESVLFDSHYADDLTPETLGQAWWWLPTEGGRDAALTAILRRAGIRTTCFAETDLSTSARRSPLWDELVQIPVEDHENAPEDELPLQQLISSVMDWLDAGQFAENSLLWIRSRGVPEPWYPPADFVDLYFPEFELVDDEAPTTNKYQPDDSPEDDDLPDDPAFDPALVTPGEDPELDLRIARALYAAYVTAIDRAVGRLIDALEKSGLLADTLVIVTAASGQLLGEHAPVGERPSHLPSELTRTLCLVRLPSLAMRGTRRHDFVQPRDVAEALVDWFTPTTTPPSPPRPAFLFQAIRGEDRLPRDGIVSFHPDLGWSVRTLSAAYCQPIDRTLPPRLFLQPFDRCEFADTSNQQPDLMEQLAAALPPLASEAGS